MPYDRIFWNGMFYYCAECCILECIFKKIMDDSILKYKESLLTTSIIKNTWRPIPSQWC